MDRIVVRNMAQVTNFGHQFIKKSVAKIVYVHTIEQIIVLTRASAKSMVALGLINTPLLYVENVILETLLDIHFLLVSLFSPKV